MKNALVIIDVQESFQHLADWHLVSEPNIVGKVNHLAEWARARGDYVVWILGSRPGTGTVFDPERGFVRLMDGSTGVTANRCSSRTHTTPSPRRACTST